MKQLISMLVVLVSGALLLALVPTMKWDGASWKPVTVRVTQGAGHTPVQGVRGVILREGEAKIWMGLGDEEQRKLLAEWMSMKIAGETAPDGKVTLHGHFPAGGQDTFLFKSGSYSLAGVLLFIRQGRVLATRGLEELVPRRKYSLRDKVPLIEMELP